MSDSKTIYLSLRSPLLWHAVAIALSLIPTVGLRYGGLGVVVVYLGVYAAHRSRPSSRLEQLNDGIKIATELLSRAISQACSRNIFKVDEIRRELLEARLLVSQIQSDLLEAHDASWIIHVQKMWAAWQKLNQCERQVRNICTMTLLTIESENQRRLAQDIQESKEISAMALHFIGNGNAWVLPRKPNLEASQEA